MAKAPVPVVIPALLIMASATAVLSTDLYTPLLPHLQGVFGADAGRVQLTLTLNLVAYALAQLFWVPCRTASGGGRCCCWAWSALPPPRLFAPSPAPSTR